MTFANFEVSRYPNIRPPKKTAAWAQEASLAVLKLHGPDAFWKYAAAWWRDPGHIFWWLPYGSRYRTFWKEVDWDSLGYNLLNLEAFLYVPSQTAMDP